MGKKRKTFYFALSSMGSLTSWMLEGEITPVAVIPINEGTQVSAGGLANFGSQSFCARNQIKKEDTLGFSLTQHHVNKNPTVHQLLLGTKEERDAWCAPRVLKF